MAEYPKFEKATDNTIRIISEKVEEVSVSNLIETLKTLETKREQLNQTIDNIKTILKNAVELGIVPEEKDKKCEA